MVDYDQFEFKFNCFKTFCYQLNSFSLKKRAFSILATFIILKTVPEEKSVAPQ